MAKQSITLKIAGKSYSLNIESEKEEVYRLAEREVNNYLAQIKQQNIKNWNDQDYLSMTALKFAIANVGMRQSREVDNEDLRQLEKNRHGNRCISQRPEEVTPGAQRTKARAARGQYASDEKRSFTYKNLPA